MGLAADLRGHTDPLREPDPQRRNERRASQRKTIREGSDRNRHRLEPHVHVRGHGGHGFSPGS